MTELQDELGALAPYFTDDFNLTNPSTEMTALFDIFKQHFIVEGVLYEGQKIWVEKKRSNIRDFYAYMATFVHVITQETRNGQREFDQDRAKRVHWIKPILTNCHDKRIHIFGRSHDKSGAPQIYFWFKTIDYVVILRAITKNKQLVTAFCVDDMKAQQFERWMKVGFIKNKPHIMCGARNLRHCE